MKNKRHGFTLIEMMVTIAIIAIIASIAMPNVNKQISQYKFNNESRDLLSLIRETRSQAILLKRDVKLNFSKSATDSSTLTNIFWSSKNAQITSPANIEFDMLGRIKTRPTNGCIAITHKSDTTLKKTIIVSVLGGIDEVKESTSC